MLSGTIHADGTVTVHGTTPMKTRVVGLSGTMIAIHYPGSTYYNNAGANYCPAWIEIKQLESLERGENPEEWIFKTKRLGFGMSFHPTIKTACGEVVSKLSLEGDRISESLKRR